MLLKLVCFGLSERLDAAYAAFDDMIKGETTPFGPPETPLGARAQDPKRYIEFGSLTDGVPDPLVELRRVLVDSVERCASELESTFAETLKRPLREMMDRSRGPLMRMTWYPAAYGGELNQPHTDIDLFTILPAATHPGLEWRRDESWVPVAIDKEEIVVMAGDMLQELGATQSIEHRVVSVGQERMSVSLFVNAAPMLLVRKGVRAGDLMRDRLEAVRRRDGRDG